MFVQCFLCFTSQNNNGSVSLRCLLYAYTLCLVVFGPGFMIKLFVSFLLSCLFFRSVFVCLFV